MTLDDGYEAEPDFSAVARLDNDLDLDDDDGDAVERSRWTLPAAPVAEALSRLRRAPGMDEDGERFSAGLGLDAAWVAAVQSGSLADLGITEIAAVCESLRCSPYDLWAPALARTILHAYGPERWPRHTEPLAPERPVGMGFVGRRLDRQAAEMVTVLDHGEVRPAPPRLGPVPVPTTTLTVTHYRQSAVLAVDAGGTSSEVPDPGAAADHRCEYHFAFAQVGPPRPLAVPVTAQHFAAGPPGGYDADPVLAGVAAVVTGAPATSGADLVRFTEPTTGAEWWLGRDATGGPADTEGTWQTWDDPREHYPGDPGDVLDHCGFPEPDSQLCLPVETPPVGDDLERAPSGPYPAQPMVPTATDSFGLTQSEVAMANLGVGLDL